MSQPYFFSNSCSPFLFPTIRQQLTNICTENSWINCWNGNGVWHRFTQVWFQAGGCKKKRGHANGLQSTSASDQFSEKGNRETGFVHKNTLLNDRVPMYILPFIYSYLWQVIKMASAWTLNELVCPIHPCCLRFYVAQSDRILLINMYLYGLKCPNLDSWGETQLVPELLGHKGAENE